MTTVWAPYLIMATLAVFTVTGVALLIGAGRRLRRRRVAAAGGHGTLGLAFLAISAVGAAVALNLQGYERLTHEQRAAELEFRRLGPQRFHATVIDLSTGSTQGYELNGDEWQMDARILKWRGMATLLGLDTRYRLERLSGRYRDIEQERSDRRSVHALAPRSELDAWALGRRLERWMPWLDAYYGSAAYLPMADGARFQISVTQSGLVGRAMNDAGTRTLKRWDQRPKTG